MNEETVEKETTNNQITKIYKNMGGASSVSEQNDSLKIYPNTFKSQSTPINPTGMLRVTITDGQILHETFSNFKMNPYAHITLSNQEKFTMVHERGDKNPSFDQTFIFHINSTQYQISAKKQEKGNIQNFKEEVGHQKQTNRKKQNKNRRLMNIQIYNQRSFGPDSLIAEGSLDLTNFISNKNKKQHLKCLLSHKNQPKGSLNFIAQFIQEEAYTLNFIFENTILRKKAGGLFNKKHIWIQVVVGEQILQTSKKSDQYDNPPNWENQILSFRVINSIKYCQITVYNDEKEIGSVEKRIGDLNSNKTQEIKQFMQDLIDIRQINVGNLKFKTFMGEVKPHIPSNSSVIMEKTPSEIVNFISSHEQKQSLNVLYFDQDSDGEEITMKENEKKSLKKLEFCSSEQENEKKQKILIDYNPQTNCMKKTGFFSNKNRVYPEFSVSEGKENC